MTPLDGWRQWRREAVIREARALALEAVGGDEARRAAEIERVWLRHFEGEALARVLPGLLWLGRGL